MLRSVRTLMAGLIDYAGLFPPAGLGMAEAVANYAAYRAGPRAWALGRFVVPAARLDELAREAAPHLPDDGGAADDVWRLSALCAEPPHDVRRIADFNERHAGRAVVDVVELRAAAPDRVAWAASLLPRGLTAYYEIPLAGDPRPLVAAIGAAGGRAKARTGGVTEDAFPPAARLARFMQACVESGVPFKATAGLHHAVRGPYRLTYEPGSACTPMFGFLNVWVAAALLRAGGSPADAARALEETAPDEFRFDDGGVTWRGTRIDDARLADVRERVAIAFGSCSFTEPVEEMEALGLL
ncbi:MAG TPA: hypothetical protein VFS05_14715 [Gemmatimonadaceae bacterium]|nr:hypothetical protein [Gemmatimonadaceae bacterium]